VASGDVEALSYKIGLLVTQDQLRRQLGLQARQWAERFDWRIIADETLSVYADVRGVPAPAPAIHPPLVAAPDIEADDCP
jgi:hypothetical protein